MFAGLLKNQDFLQLFLPSSIGSSGVNSFMALDLLLGSLSGSPTLSMNHHATIAWLPVDQASSAKGAMDKWQSYSQIWCMGIKQLSCLIAPLLVRRLGISYC